jgi:hypothetical protein
MAGKKQRAAARNKIKKAAGAAKRFVRGAFTFPDLSIHPSSVKTVAPLPA